MDNNESSNSNIDVKQIKEDIIIEDSSEEENNDLYLLNGNKSYINEKKYLKNSFENSVAEFIKNDEDTTNIQEYLKVDNYIGEFIKDDNITIIKGFICEKYSYRLYYSKIFIKDISYKSNIWMLHGYGNSNNFIEIASKFASEGYIVHLYDLRGFGYSGGIKFNSTIEENFDDLVMVLKLIKNNLPLFIVSYDFSCNIVMQFLILNNINIAGVIYLSPLLIPSYYYGSVYNFIKRYFIILCSKFLDDLLICNFYNNGYIVKNINILKNRNSFNSNIPHFGIKFISLILETGEFIKNNSHNLITPTLLIHGKKNKISNLKLILKTFNKISSSDKIAKLLINGYHEIYNDYEKEDISTLILEWIDKRNKVKNTYNSKQLKKIIYKKKGRNIKKIVKFILIILYFKFLIYFRNNKYFKNNIILLILYPIYFSIKLSHLYFKMVKNITTKFYSEVRNEFIKNL